MSKIKEAINPSHYKVWSVETIELIQMGLSEEEFRGFLKGNILKYRLRAGFKGDAMQDLEKSMWYLNKLQVLNEDSN